jgi:hypothetical protein
VPAAIGAGVATVTGIDEVSPPSGGADTEDAARSSAPRRTVTAPATAPASAPPPPQRPPGISARSTGTSTPRRSPRRTGAPARPRSCAATPPRSCERRTG